MDGDRSSEGDLLADLRAFGARVLVARDLLSSGGDLARMSDADAIAAVALSGSGGADRPTGASAERLSNVADQLAADLSARMERAGVTPASATWRRDAYYAMAALADDILEFEVGGGGWLGHLLEARLFGSRAAGDRLLDMIAALDSAPRTRANGDLAMVYLTVLALGFRGRLRFFPDAFGRVVDRLRTFIAVAHGGGDATDSRLTPAAYGHVVAGSPTSAPASARPWVRGAWAVLVAFLIASALILASVRSDLGAGLSVASLSVTAPADGPTRLDT